ncbi:hypothetical protein AAEX28_08535 [Lentisphaerota bacterium WC36G]|nr:hypothetical protein LJT99_11390 [Lentisphaerae bacterium WC36]
MKVVYFCIIILLTIKFPVTVKAKSEDNKKQDSKYVLVLKNATKHFVPINIKYKNEWNELFYDGKVPSKNSNIAKFVDMIEKSKSLKIISENYLKIKNHKGKLARRNSYNYHNSIKETKGVVTFVYYYKIAMAQYLINKEWDKFLDTFDRYIYFNSVVSSGGATLPIHFPELYYLLQKKQAPNYVYDRMNDKINGLIKFYLDVYLDEGYFISTLNYYRVMQILNLSLKYKNNHGKWPTAFDTEEIAILFKTLSSSTRNYEIALNNLDSYQNQFEFGFLLKITKKDLESQYFGGCLNPIKIMDKESVKTFFYKDLFFTFVYASESLLTNSNYKKYFSFIKDIKFEKITI